MCSHKGTLGRGIRMAGCKRVESVAFAMAQEESVLAASESLMKGRGLVQTGERGMTAVGNPAAMDWQIGYL